MYKDNGSIYTYQVEKDLLSHLMGESLFILMTSLPDVILFEYN